MIVEAPNNPPVFIKPSVREIIVDFDKYHDENLNFTLPKINDIDSNDKVTVRLE